MKLQRVREKETEIVRGKGERKREMREGKTEREREKGRKEMNERA